MSFRNQGQGQCHKDLKMVLIIQHEWYKQFVRYILQCVSVRKGINCSNKFKILFNIMEREIDVRQSGTASAWDYQDETKTEM